MKSSNPAHKFSLSTVTTYQAGVAQARAHRIVKHHTDHLLKDFNLTSMQWFTIGTVLDAGTDGVRLSDLAKELDTTLAYMTTTVNLLESRGILNKHSHPYDARTKIITVKPSYKKTCSKIERALRDRLRDIIYRHIDPQDMATHVAVLYELGKLR